MANESSTKSALRVFPEDARGCQCPFVLCLHPQGCLQRGFRARERWGWRSSHCRAEETSPKRIRLFATPWTAAYQAPPSMGFFPSTCAHDLRELSGVPLRSQGYCGVERGFSGYHRDWCNCAFTFHFPALEKEMATHSSIVAWKIPYPEKPLSTPQYP